MTLNEKKKKKKEEEKKLKIINYKITLLPQKKEPDT